jgi:hypothetical protein
MGSKGMFLSHWTLDFDLKYGNLLFPCMGQDSASPIIFWDEATLKTIGDKLGHYID